MTDEGAKDRAPQAIDSSTARNIDKTGGPLSNHHPQPPSGSESLDGGGNPKSQADLSMPTENLMEFSCNLLSQDPSSQVFVPLAEEFCARKLWKEAVETCRRGLVYHPRQFRGRVLLGWALWELGEVEEAERLLIKAGTELEKNAVIYRILAELAERRGDSDQAWRLMHIYQSLQDGHLRRRSEIQATKITETLIPEPREKEESLFIDFFSSLLMQYEQKQPATIPTLHLFSGADRSMLKEIINAGTS